MRSPAFLCLLLSFPAALSAGREAAFLEEKKDILSVTVERVRRVPSDVQRALKAGENRLRGLHEDFKVAKSTPPASLESDVRELRDAIHRVRVARSRGERPLGDPRAQELIRGRWESYRARTAALLEDARYKRDSGQSESAVYWQSVKDQQALGEELAEVLAYNPPPGESSVEEAVAKDQEALLKSLESPDRVRGRLACVEAPGRHVLRHAFDIAPFYRAAGLLPGTNPVRTGAFQVSPGCRTVTQREFGARLIIRAARGKGVLLVGAEDRPLVYEYALVPPEAPYLIENAGREPLVVELVALLP